MGLKGDFDEVRRAWPTYPWRLRVYLIFSAVLASNSIATLSDTVFRWKAFIKDALSFYQNFVAAPLYYALASLFPRTLVPPGLPHFLILSALYLGANLRVAAFSQPSSRARVIALHAATSYIGACLALSIGLHLTGRALDAESSLGLFIGSGLCASVSYLAIGGAARVLWFVHLGAPFAATALLAAINSGLVRVQ